MHFAKFVNQNMCVIKRNYERDMIITILHKGVWIKALHLIQVINSSRLQIAILDIVTFAMHLMALTKEFSKVDMPFVLL